MLHDNPTKSTPEQFMDYFRRNYPGPNTIIARPDWHAPKIYAAALAASQLRELLEALKECRFQLGYFAGPHDDAANKALLQADAAIQKAEGV